MFGRHDRMTEKFPLGGNQSGETGKQLRSILKAAAQAIRESPCSARRLQARCMPYVPNKMRELPEPFLDYFTHITADESELPWNVQEQFEEATAPVGEYFRASKAWVNAVGLGRPHDDEGVED